MTFHITKTPSKSFYLLVTGQGITTDTHRSASQGPMPTMGMIMLQEDVLYLQ
jgi:hypothetical protein